MSAPTTHATSGAAGAFAGTAATATPGSSALPWLVDITPVEPDLSDLDDDLWLADVALAVLVGALLIVAAGFVAGYTFARMG
jgi:hypothetical protein